MTHQPPDEDVLRPARDSDRDAIEALITRSVEGLMADDYDEAQRAAARTHVFGVDGELVSDGTYLVIERGGALVAAGGWSRRRTLFGGDAAAVGRTEGAPLDPAVDRARIRAFFVDPAHARRGLGRRLLAACLEGARAAGFREVELVATHTGEHLYAAAGFRAHERWEVALPGGVGFGVVRMTRAV